MTLMVAEADKRIHMQVEETAVQVRATHMQGNLHIIDWVAVQQEDPILKIVMEWISSHKVQDLKHLLGDHAMTEEGMAILRERREIYTPSGCPLSLPYSGWRAGRSSAICSPHMVHRVVAMKEVS